MTDRQARQEAARRSDDGPQCPELCVGCHKICRRVMRRVTTLSGAPVSSNAASHELHRSWPEAAISPARRAVSLSHTNTRQVAPLSRADALHNLETLQNLAFLIEKEASSPENVRAHVKTMNGILNDLSRHLLTRPEPRILAKWPALGGHPGHAAKFPGVIEPFQFDCST